MTHKFSYAESLNAHQEFNAIQHILQLYYNLLSRNLRNTTFNVILMLNLFVF